MELITKGMEDEADNAARLHYRVKTFLGMWNEPPPNIEVWVAMVRNDLAEALAERMDSTLRGGFIIDLDWGDVDPLRDGNGTAQVVGIRYASLLGDSTGIIVEPSAVL
jgi:hypothetical protein